MATLFPSASRSSSNLFGIVRGAILMMVLFSNNVLSFISSSYNKLVLTNGMSCHSAAAMTAGVPKSRSSSWVRYYYYSSRGSCSISSTSMLLLLTDNSKKVQKQHHYCYFKKLLRLSFMEGSGVAVHTSASDNSDTNPSSRNISTTTSTDREVSSSSGPSSPIAKSISSTWNLPGLLKETNRCISRCYKKIDKVNARYTKVLQHDGSNTSSTATSTSAEEAIILEEMKYLRKRLADLHQLLEYLLQINDSTTQQTILLPEHIASLALQLEINDTPPPRPPKPNSVIKAAPENAVTNSSTGPRKPYRRYYTENKTEIRVGKAAEDNDELTLNPKYRDGNDWWLHASGCPGSHVVIRSNGNDILEHDVVQDAAALAARQSKCTGSVIKVTMTRCKDIVKPPGAKPGLVQLRGNVKTIAVNMKQAQVRLERLDKTVLIN